MGQAGIDRVVITCEHGGNEVPPGYARLFRARREVLRTHRGYDIGALAIAKDVAEGLDAPLHASTNTRLLIDLNRSIGRPALFSEFTGGLDAKAKQDLIQRHYAPYRAAVERRIGALAGRGFRVLHLSIHTFTPVLRGQRRDADIGLLYDPRRALEKQLASGWRWTLGLEGPFRVRFNYPYLGRSDGFTTHLRGRFPSARYLGIELEVNQRLLTSRRSEPWVRGVVVESLQTLLGPSSRRR
jgi:predicted N-formylglutamate amidohydrolase